MEKIIYTYLFCLITIFGCGIQSDKEKQLEQRINKLEQKEQATTSSQNQELPKKEKILFQMTASQMIKIFKMSYNQFEKYATNNGFIFWSHVNQHLEGGFQYYNVDEGKYLTLYSQAEVIYQTTNKSEFSNFRKQLKKLGFESVGETNNEVYSESLLENETYKVKIMTHPKHDIYDETYVIYFESK